MKISKFISEISQIPVKENYKNLTLEEKEKYLELKAKVKFTSPISDDYSKLIETSKQTGKIAISIDPLDYILMSMNKSGWSSCYAIANSSGESRSWGSYVGGLFSYMCDNTTIIGYRHSDKMYEYQIGKSTFEEYSKNWRQLIYLDTKNYGFICSRQYPFRDENLASELRGLVEKTLDDNTDLGSDWKTCTISEKNIRYIQNKIKPTTTEFCYNDILRSNHVYGEKMVWSKKLNNKEELVFTTDSTPICFVCGEKNIDDENYPSCYDCYCSKFC